MKKAKKITARKAKKTSRRATHPKKSTTAALQLHRFLDLWNAHIREQIKIHQLILKGKETLKTHIRHTEKAHEKFLSQLKKI